MDSIASGRLKHTVTLQTWNETGTDDHGHPQGEWWNTRELRVAIEPVGPRDAEVVNQLYHEATHVVWVRYHEDIVRDAQLIFGSRTFHIGYVQNMEERNRVMKLLCTEVLT